MSRRSSPRRETIERLTFVAAAVLLFVMIPFDSRAQTTPPASAEAAASAPEVASSQTITVTGTRTLRDYQVPRASTATKTDTLLLDTPQAIAVVPREVLEDQGARQVADAMRNVSGVSREASYWGQEGNSFRIRGFALSDEHGYYKDGFRYNAKGTTVMNNVERVEVLKGPASVLYGRAEPGGIINLVTRRPEKNAEQELELSLGRWNNVGIAADATGPLDEARTLLYRIDASAERGDSFRDGVLHRTVSVAPTLHWQATPATRVELSGEAVWDRRRTDYGIPSYRGLPAAVPISTYYGEAFNRQKSRQDRLALAVDHRLSERWQLKAQAAQTRLRYPVYRDVYAGFVDDETAELAMYWEDYPDRYTNRFAQLDAIGKFRTGPLAHTLLIGAEVGRQLQRQDGSAFGDYFSYDIFNPQPRGIDRALGPTSVSNYRLDTTSQALYLQDQIDWGEQWKLLIGLRYDRYEQDYLFEPLSPDDEDITGPFAATITRDQSVNPRLGLVFKPRPDLSLYASLARSFAPAFPYSQAVQNVRFQPERGQLREIGAKGEGLDGKVSATLALYDLRKRNVLNADPDNPQFSIQNGEEASRGLEIDFAAQPVRGWNVMASFAYMRARLTESTDYPLGNTLPLAPRLSGSLWTSHEWRAGALKGLSLGGGLFAQGARYTDLFNNVVLPRFVRADLSAGWRVGAWRMTANLKNATNRRYFESSNSSAVIFPGAPRELQLTLGVTL